MALDVLLFHSEYYAMASTVLSFSTDSLKKTQVTKTIVYNFERRYKDTHFKLFVVLVVRTSCKLLAPRIGDKFHELLLHDRLTSRVFAVDFTGSNNAAGLQFGPCMQKSKGRKGTFSDRTHLTPVHLVRGVPISTAGIFGKKGQEEVIS